LGGKKVEGCKDKTPPKESKPIRIPYSLYFAKQSQYWENGGVAFISLERESDESNWTLGRMWKITKEQYEEVKNQEGEWYNYEICLGEEYGISIYTITNKYNLNIKKPSEGYKKPSKPYLKTISLGLKETYNFSKIEIYGYLIQKDGIKSNFTKDELMVIIKSVILSNRVPKD
jgi:hypothetical protein